MQIFGICKQTKLAGDVIVNGGVVLGYSLLGQAQKLK